MSFPGSSQLLGEALIFGIAFGGDRLSTCLLGAGCALLFGLAGCCSDRLRGAAGFFGGLRIGKTAGFGALTLLLHATSIVSRFSESLGGSELLGAALFFGDTLSLALFGESLLASSFPGCRFSLTPFFRSFCLGSNFRFRSGLCFRSRFRICRGFCFSDRTLGLGLHARGGRLAFLFGTALGIGLGSKPCLSFIGRSLGSALRFEFFAARIGFAAGAGKHVGFVGLHAVFRRALLSGIGLALFGVGFLFCLRGSTLLSFLGGPISLRCKFLGDGVTIGGLRRRSDRLQPNTGRNCNPQSRH